MWTTPNGAKQQEGDVRVGKEVRSPEEPRRSHQLATGGVSAQKADQRFAKHGGFNVGSTVYFRHRGKLAKSA